MKNNPFIFEGWTEAYYNTFTKEELVHLLLDVDSKVKKAFASDDLREIKEILMKLYYYKQHNEGNVN